jgi:hypothetical protein
MMQQTDENALDDLRDVRLLLAGTDPVPAAIPTRADHRQARRVLRALKADMGRSRARVTPRVRILAASGGVLAAVSLVLVAMFSGGGSVASAAPLLPTPLFTATSGDHSSAVGLLRAAAVHQRAASVEGSGPVHYTLRQTYGLDVTVAHRASTTMATTYLVREWRRPDGSGRVDQSLQHVDRAGRDVGGPTPASSPHRPSVEVPAGPAGSDVAFLPTDPDQLRAWLADSVRLQGLVLTDGDTGRMIFDYLAGGGTSPAQNAAMFEVLAGLPGAFDAGRAVDRAGRPARAVGIQISGPGSLVTATGYLLLSDTGTPLTLETVYTPDAPPGLHFPPGPTVGEYVQILVERRVAAVGATG